VTALINEIEVGTEKGNAAAQRFYRNSGFDVEYVLFGMEFHERADARRQGEEHR